MGQVLLAQRVLGQLRSQPLELSRHSLLRHFREGDQEPSGIEAAEVFPEYRMSSATTT
jgi:hypothetical protein